MSPNILTGNETYVISYRSTDEQSNFQKFTSGKVKTEMAGFLTKFPNKNNIPTAALKTTKNENPHQIYRF